MENGQKKESKSKKQLKWNSCYCIFFLNFPTGHQKCLTRSLTRRFRFRDDVLHVYSQSNITIIMLLM